MTGVELIVIDVALLRRRDRNFLVITSASILEDTLQMVFLYESGSAIMSSWVAGVRCWLLGIGCQEISRGQTRDIMQRWQSDMAHLFLSLLDTGRDLGIRSKCLVL